MPRHELSRRTVLAGLVGLAACGSGRTRSSSSSSTAAASPTTTPATTPPVVAGLSPLEVAAGQILLIGFRGTTAPPSSTIAADLRDRAIGGVVLFDYDVPSGRHGRNITDPAQLAALCAQLREASGSTRLLIAVDEEGGQVARLGAQDGYPAIPSAREVGAGGDPAIAGAVGEQVARMLAAAGITIDLAPVVDVNTNPSNPIIGALGRSYSADPAVVTSMAGAMLDGLHRGGVLGVLKHFPGHGSSTGDTHLGVVDVTSTWTTTELYPYKALLSTSSVDAVMVAHVFNRNLDADHPASLSSSTIEGLLRGQLGYRGPVISDDLQMNAIASQYSFEDTVRLALDAGNDLLCFGNNITYDEGLGAKAHATVLDLVASGAISEGRVFEAQQRVATLRR